MNLLHDIDWLLLSGEFQDFIKLGGDPSRVGMSDKSNTLWVFDTKSDIIPLHVHWNQIFII